MNNVVEHVERIFGLLISISSEIGFAATTRPKCIRQYAL